MRFGLIAGLGAAFLALGGCSQDTAAGARDAATVTTVSMEPAAVMERWESELGGRYRAAAALEEAEFVEAWDADLAFWQAELEVTGAGPVDFERTRYEWAFGRMLYPVLHARLTGQPREQPSEGYHAYLDKIELERPDLLELEEYTGFIETMAEMSADEIFEAPDFEGALGALYLDARLAAAEQFENDAVRCHLQAGVFDYWLESFDGQGAQTQLQAFAQDCPGERTAAILAAFAEEYSMQQGRRVEVYKTVEGYGLEMHIFHPDDHSAEDARPAALHFHGGGWFFGNWTWCGPCRFFKERGHVVIQVEYRVRGRFRTRAGDSLEDVGDAVAWVRANADRLGVDPDRIAAIGFSAGGHLSMTSGALQAPGDPRRPDLVAAFSGCAAMDDTDYTIRMAGGMEEAVRLSPVRLDAPSSPPIFFANARRDTDCDFATVAQYAANLEANGNTVRLHDGGERGHFFMRDPEAAAAVHADLYAFLDAQGW